MEVLVLGPLRIVAGASEVVLERPKERTVLSVLAMHADEAVMADQLIEALWRDSPPRTAAKTLQNHVLRLRRSLGRECIHTEPEGYRLAIAPQDVDAIRFDEIVRKAALGDSSPGAVTKALRTR